MSEQTKYLFGPVPSRRLGLSLGVDTVPFKVCTLDCVYCQLGKTTEKTIERKEYVTVENVIRELQQRLIQGLHADYITLSGSGEPTLNSSLGRIIDRIKEITDIPVAILTNSTLLWDESVRTECAKADLVLPSLDAGDEETFQKLNRPHSDVSLDKLIDGLRKFRNQFEGQIWLEIFLVDGLNTTSAQVKKIADAVKIIQPDKIQLNTAVRPTAEPGIKILKNQRLEEIALCFGQNCEIIADYSDNGRSKNAKSMQESTLSVLKRRPCTIDDICNGLGIHRNEALKYITHFQKMGAVQSERKNGILFFRAN